MVPCSLITADGDPLALTADRVIAVEQLKCGSLHQSGYGGEGVLYVMMGETISATRLSPIMAVRNQFVNAHKISLCDPPMLMPSMLMAMAKRQGRPKM